jgi:predicted O-methyltransferase YrrM
MAHCHYQFNCIIVALFSITLIFATAYISLVNQSQGFKQVPKRYYDMINSTVSSQVIQNDECYEFDPHATPTKLFQAYFAVKTEPDWIARPALYSVSFQELHDWLFGLETPNLYESWPNHFKKKFDGSYPHTSLTETWFTSLLNQIDLPIYIVVEVGSFMGKSATMIGTALKKEHRWANAVLLCIDTWLGGLEHWHEKPLRQMMHIEYGRPTVYEQFIANIIAANLTKHVIPFSTTSILGARFLLDKKVYPQVIFLDSAHLQGETYVELELYWLLVQPGGVLLGDDWSWPSVHCDVLRFTKTSRLNLTVVGNLWYIIKKSI